MVGHGLLQVAAVSSDLFKLLGKRLGFFGRCCSIIKMTSNGGCLASMTLERNMEIVSMPVGHRVGLLFSVRSLVVLVTLFVGRHPCVIRAGAPGTDLLSVVTT